MVNVNDEVIKRIKVQENITVTYRPKLHKKITIKNIEMLKYKN